MSKRFGDARMPSLRDKINGLVPEEVSEKTVKVKKVKVGKVSSRSKVKVKKL
jgi:hypothetical protein